MTDLELDESYLRGAARLLTDAASVIRGTHPLPMIQTDTYTGIGPAIGSFMKAASVATESLSDSAGEAAVSVTAIMTDSTDMDAEISKALGPGFTN